MSNICPPWLWITHAGTETPLNDWVLGWDQVLKAAKKMGAEPREMGMKEVS